MSPTPDHQIRFLVNLQRLLDEGQFVASHKFALLLSLADLAVENGDDSGSSLTLTTDNIAEKFIQYSGGRAAPFPSAKASILQQNTGKQASVVNILQTARSKHGDSLASIMRKSTWKALRREASSVVRIMPLRKLQTVGRERLAFLYAHAGAGKPLNSDPVWRIVCASSTV